MSGRPTKFNGALAEEICIRISCGESLASICRDDDMPGYRTVITWLGKHEEFQHNYARAREEQGDADADSIADVGRRVLLGELDPQAARVAIDALKWTAGRRKPKVYGDKIVQEQTGPNGGPIESRVTHTVDPKDIESAVAKLKGL